MPELCAILGAGLIFVLRDEIHRAVQTGSNRMRTDPADAAAEDAPCFYVPVKLHEDRLGAKLYVSQGYSAVMGNPGLQRELRRLAARVYTARRKERVEINGRLHSAEILFAPGRYEEGLVETSAQGYPIGAPVDQAMAMLERTSDYMEWVRSACLLSESLARETSVSLDTGFIEPELKRVRITEHGIQEAETLDLAALARDSRVVVLGEPGSGKTSILRRLALDSADGRFADWARGTIPVYIQLRDLADRDLGLWIAEEIVAQHGGVDALPLFRLPALSGHILLLIDGLDELAADEVRLRVIDEVEGICKVAPNIRIVVSTREAAYPRTLTGFTHVRIQPFDQRQIRHWTRNYFMRTHAKLGRVQWRQFNDQLSAQPDILQMARNPLFLSIAAFLFDRYGVTPTHRATLFERYLVAILEQWDAVRGITREGQAQLLDLRALLVGLEEHRLSGLSVSQSRDHVEGEHLARTDDDAHQ